MRKIIKRWLCKVLHIKECQCQKEVDPHEELYLHTPEPEVPAYNRKHKKGSE